MFLIVFASVQLCSSQLIQILSDYQLVPIQKPVYDPFIIGIHFLQNNSGDSFDITYPILFKLSISFASFTLFEFLNKLLLDLEEPIL